MSSRSRIKGYLCPKCGWADFQPRETCPRCSAEMNEFMFAGEGRVATFTVIRYPPKGFEEEAPYIVALIDIDDGPRIIGRILAKPGEVEVGSAVTLAGSRTEYFEFRLIAHQGSGLET